MPPYRIGDVRERVRSRRFDLTAHAYEEMAEDGLDILDLEHAIETGRIARIEKDDPRGTRYIIEGVTSDDTTRMGVVGRFKENGRFLVITVHAIIEP